MAADETPAHERGLPTKVIGLGAPISVRIHFEITEIPALVDAIEDELNRYGDSPQRDGDSAPETDPAEWDDHIGELRRMLGDVQAAKRTEAHGHLDVLWPTVLARDVVHGAVRHARRRVRAAHRQDVTAAREALAAAERTRRDFDAVDNGGRDAVWL